MLAPRPGRLFTCPRCAAPLTAPVRRLPPALHRPDHWDRCARLPGGCYQVAPDPARLDHPITLCPASARGLVLHPDPQRSTGCCGPAWYPNQPNLCCARCGAEVGMLLADGDHAIHELHLGDHGPEVSVLGPSDEQVAARLQRFGRAAAGVPWSTPFPAHLTGDAHWIDDLDTLVLEVPTLRELRVELVPDTRGSRLVLWLDGEPVVPPWPAAEVEAIASLGQIAAGDPLLEWQAWLPVMRGAESWRHAAVPLPNGEIVLCALWWRQDTSEGVREQTLAFQFPLDHWELAFAEASARLDEVVYGLWYQVS